MTESELGEIERRLGFSLPQAYRSTVLDYPFAPDSFPSGCLLPNRPTDVIDLNETAVPVPAEVVRPFFVGSDGGEESYFVDASRSESPVFAFDLETGRSRIQSPSWDQYLQHIRGAQADIAADEGAARQRKLTKRWWQFWK